MPDTADTRDRVIAVQARLDALERTVEKNGAVIREIHELVLEARGAAKVAKWTGHVYTVGIAYLVAHGVPLAGLLPKV